MSGTCLGAVAAALVDGELDHAARERAHRHLTHCAGCRAEVDGQRRLKARLAGAGHADPPAGLTDRLLHLTVPDAAPAAQDVRPPSRASAAQPVTARAADSRSGPTGARRRAARRRASTGSALALLGVASALALGAPPSRPANAPVEPATDAFVAELVGTTPDGPAAVVPVPAARTAGLTTFVPLTRTALLRAGGARTAR